MSKSTTTHATPLRPEEIRFFAALGASQDSLAAREELLRLERAHLNALERAHRDRIGMRLGIREGVVRIDWESMTAIADAPPQPAVRPSLKEE